MNDFTLQRKLVAKLHDAPAAFQALLQLLEARRGERRQQHENAMGEPAIVLRGQVRELTALLNDLGPEAKGEQL